MSDRAMMYCPTCRNLAAITSNIALKTIELMRDPDACRCANGHTFPDYMALMAMEPEKIKYVQVEKAHDNDTKVDIWVDKDILAQFQALKPNCLNATVESIMRLYLVGDPIIIDAGQSKRMRALGVRNGQEMLAALEVGKDLEGQLATATEKIAMFQSMFAGAGIQLPV